MQFARPLMWNIPHWAEYLFYGLIPLVLIAFLGGAIWRIRKWMLGRADPETPSVIGRLRGLLTAGRLFDFVKNALFQWRLSRDWYATAMHLAIFWGMVVLFLGTALATVDQDFLNLPFDYQVLTGNVYRVFELALDVFGVLLIVGVLLAGWRRFLVRPERLGPNKQPVSRWDGFPFLTMLFLIAVTGFVIEGLRLAEGFRIEQQLIEARGGTEAKLALLERLEMPERLSHVGQQRREAEIHRIAEQQRVFPAATWAPVGYLLGRLFFLLPDETIRLAHHLTWWGHGLLAFAFIIAIPFTKAFHLISSPINILFRSESPVGRLGIAANSGVETVRDYTWRQLLQVDSCTWCGRCQEVCPGYNTGFPLSPRHFVQAVDGQLLRTPAKDGGNGRSLHEVIDQGELWACCTCRACEEICPVCIEHPRLIIDMRRKRVDRGELDEGLQDTLMNYQRYGNSFGQSPRKRSAWTKQLDFPVKSAGKEPVEYLWFVGDYASYDQRAQQVTQKIARVFHALGLDVGMLAEKEQNAGNDVRRIGEEGLFEMLREKNIAALQSAEFQCVITTDPHTYNTLKNEYDQAENGGRSASPLAGKPVLHYTELLDRLVTEGKLPIARPLAYTVTYHDPCYLGRFNGVYEAPRRVLAALGVRLVEMPRNRSNSFCCGAGGGRIWMKDTPGIEERPAEVRVKEALALPGVELLVVACPKDLVMFQDAVKTVGAEDRLRVVDLGELVLEAMQVTTPVETGESR